MLGRYIYCNLLTERLYSVSISGLVTLDCNRFIGGMGGGRIGLAVFESEFLAGVLLVGRCVIIGNCLSVNGFLIIGNSILVDCRLLSVVFGRNIGILSVMEWL